MAVLIRGDQVDLQTQEDGEKQQKEFAR